MTTVERTERILKDMERLSTEANEAAGNMQVLEEKVSAFRTIKMVDKCRHDILLRYHELENCEKFLDKNVAF